MSLWTSPPLPLVHVWTLQGGVRDPWDGRAARVLVLG